MKFKKGQIYEGEYTNIFVIMVVGNEVHFIDGTSPSAIHEIQKIEPQHLEEYINTVINVLIQNMRHLLIVKKV